MPKYQYTVTKVASVMSKEAREVHLNKMGDGGWQLVFVVGAKGSREFYWERVRE